MTSKSSFSAAEWAQLTSAPYWVYAAVATVDGRQAILTRRKESKAMDDALESKSSNAFVRAVLADVPEDTPKELNRAKFTDAINALNKIGDLLEDKADAADMDAYNDFLLGIGKAVANAAGEGAFGLGDKTSDDEKEALEAVTNALQASASDKAERAAAARAADAAAQAKVRAQAKARRDEAAQKAQAEREAREKQAELQAKMKAARERQAKERQLAEEAAHRREVAQQRIEETRKEQAAAAAKERHDEMMAERKAKADAAKQAADEAAAQAAAAEAEAAKWVGEHTVVSGDTLSGIALKFYGSAARDKWMAIYEANKEIIGANPSLIRVGQTFKIPKLD
ncbi:MAG: LysM peptidoglycan-binding domain-containing protein [Anaerolineales bacterium]|nr:LysM peptidoglycan-binding domain-containing protein [Anaerolineales bacterium]MCB0015619.1 LysM peptidoglycan-binding domain-containing protein [Anaerolineales bacterium]